MRQSLRDPAIVAGVDHDDDVGEVLGRRTDHRRTANVDVLQGHIQRGIGTADRLDERIKIAHYEVDRTETVLGQLRGMVGQVAPRKDAGVDRRMQRLYTPIQHLREPRQVRHLLHRQTRVPERLVGPAGTHQADARFAQSTGEVLDAGLVVNAKYGFHETLSSTNVAEDLAILQLRAQSSWNGSVTSVW